MTSIFTISISHFYHSVFSLFFLGRLRGSWVAQLVGLAMGFGGFLIRVTVVFGGCWPFSADVAGFFGDDCERITGLWFWILTAIVEASQPRWDAVRSWACISISSSSSSSLSPSFFFSFFLRFCCFYILGLLKSTISLQMRWWVWAFSFFYHSLLLDSKWLVVKDSK